MSFIKALTSTLTLITISLTAACSNTELLEPQILANDSIETFGTKKNSNTSYKEISVSTYNVKSLFDVKVKAKSEKELKALAASIRDMNSDVIALQEVQSNNTLKNFNDKYLKDLGYKVAMKEENNLDTAILTKLDIESVKSTTSGNLLQAKLIANQGYSFTLFVAHLKSSSQKSQPDPQMMESVQKIREFIRLYEKENRFSNYILAGDLNATPDSVELQGILDPRSSGLNFHDVVIQDLGSNVYTYSPKKDRSRLDYILVSAGMVREYNRKSVQIHKSPKSGNPNMYLDASDHLPITATFNVEVDTE